MLNFFACCSCTNTKAFPDRNVLNQYSKCLLKILVHKVWEENWHFSQDGAAAPAPALPQATLWRSRTQNVSERKKITQNNFLFPMKIIKVINMWLRETGLYKETQ